MTTGYRRGDVYWAHLDPTVGTVISKSRPVLILSPDDMNDILPRVIIAPLTTKGKSLGSRIDVRFRGMKGKILLDQLRTVDKVRLTKKMGSIDQKIWLPTLLEMFA